MKHKLTLNCTLKDISSGRYHIGKEGPLYVISCAVLTVLTLNTNNKHM